LQLAGQLVSNSTTANRSVGYAKAISLMLSWLFVATTLGYPLVGLISAAANLPSVVLSYPFRGVVVALSIVLIYSAVKNPRRNVLDAVILLFWILYLFRFGWDILIANTPGADFAVLVFGLTILIPCSAMMISGWAIDEHHLLSLYFITGAFICFCVVMMQLLGIGVGTSLTEETGRLSFEAVNPITLGHAGTSTIIAGIALLGKKKSAIVGLVLVPGIGFAFACMILAASRGPLLALVFALIFLAYSRRHFFFLVMGICLTGAYVTAIAAQGTAIEIFTRFSNISEDESALERILIQVNSFEQFLGSPWLGSAYIELTTGFIPHNMLLESAMALGVVGVTLFLIVSIRAVRHAFDQARLGCVFLPMLYIQSLLNTQLSGSLWQSADFWALSILLATSVNQQHAAKSCMQGNRY
jgi:hypothetical protein